MLTQRFLNGHNRLLAQCVASMNLLSVRDVHHHMERDDFNLYVGIKRSNPQKANRNTHVNEKPWRRARGRKNIPIELPDFRKEKEESAMSPAETRVALLRRGFNIGKDVASREWSENQLTMHSMYGVADAYVPTQIAFPTINLRDPVGSIQSMRIQPKDRVMNWWRTWRNGTRLIKKKEGLKNFNKKDFALEAERIYIDAYKALAERNKDQLLGLITESAYEKMWPDVERGTLHWEHCGYKSPSKVLNIRCADYPPSSGNHIAQALVQMHSVQKYALYDRFGRLLLGSPTEPREFIEYVVFENHIAREGSVWRLMDKVYPKWCQRKDAIINRPKLLENLNKSELPETTVEIGHGWEDKVKSDEAKLAKEKGEEKEESK